MLWILTVICFYWLADEKHGRGKKCFHPSVKVPPGGHRVEDFPFKDFYSDSEVFSPPLNLLTKKGSLLNLEGWQSTKELGFTVNSREKRQIMAIVGRNIEPPPQKKKLLKRQNLNGTRGQMGRIISLVMETSTCRERESERVVSGDASQATEEEGRSVWGSWRLNLFHDCDGLKILPTLNTPPGIFLFILTSNEQ